MLTKYTQASKHYPAYFREWSGPPDSAADTMHFRPTVGTSRTYPGYFRDWAEAPPFPSQELRAEAVSQIPGCVQYSREMYHVAGSLSSATWNAVRGGAANGLYRWAYRHGYTSSGDVEAHFGWEIENEMERQGLSGPRGYTQAPPLPPGTVLTAEIIAPRLPPLVTQEAKGFPKNISAISWNFIRDAVVRELSRWAHQHRYVPTESDTLLAQFGYLIEAEMERQGYVGAEPIPVYIYTDAQSAIDAAIDEVWAAYPGLTPSALPIDFNWSGFVSGILGIAQSKWMQTS